MRVSRLDGRDRITSSRAESPLRLMATRGEGAAWIFATTFGGGLVDGDAIGLDINVDENAQLLLTTQASTKVYSSPSGTSNVLRARVGDGGFFASIPDPTVCFDGARYTQRIEVDLAPTASAAIVDVLHAGRVSRGERWAMHFYRSTLIVRRGVPLIADALVLDPAHGSIASRLGRFDVLGTVVLVGPRLESARQRVAAEMSAPERGADLVIAASARDDLLLIRFAATHAELAMHRLRTLLTETTALVGDVLSRKR